MLTAARPKLSTDALPGFEPAWEVVTLFPPQGAWTEADYREITKRTNRPVELVDGRIEFLPMPTVTHRLIAHFFCNLLMALRAGIAVPAAFKLQLRDGRYREPDVVFLLQENLAYFSNDEWTRADLAVEVVSPDDPNRDYVDKRLDYAAAGIREYWIVDPQSLTVTLLKLANGQYVQVGVYEPGQSAVSTLLPQLTVDVDELFASGRVTTNQNPGRSSD